MGEHPAGLEWVVCLLTLAAGFGVVYKVNKGKQVFAVKVLEDNGNLVSLQQEIGLQSYTPGPNVVSIIDTYYFDDKLWVGSTMNLSRRSSWNT